MSVSIKPFTLTEFEADGAIDFVPSKWIVENGDLITVPFPKSKTASFQKLQKQAESEPAKSWPKWRIRKIVKRYDTAERAEKNAQKYLTTSDLETSAAESREQVPRHKAVPASSSSETFQQQIISSVPSTSLFQEEAASASVATSAPGDQNEIPQSSINVILEENAQGIPPVILTSFPADVDFVTVLAEQREFQRKSIENQETIKREQREIKSLLLRVLLANSSTEPQSSPSPSAFASIPLKSFSDFDKLDKSLEERGEFDQLLAALKRFERTEFRRTLSDILEYLFEHKFLRKVRATARSPGKVAFEGRKLHELVKEVINQTHPHVKDKEINDYVGTWFRGTAGRGGGRKKKGNGNSKIDKSTESTAEDNGHSKIDDLKEGQAESTESTPSNSVASDPAKKAAGDISSSHSE